MWLHAPGTPGEWEGGELAGERQLRLESWVVLGAVGETGSPGLMGS